MRVFGVHGVNEAERVRSQPFEVDLDIEVDTATSSRTDELRDTADYSAAADVVTEVIAGPARNLLESLAADIATGILRDPNVRSVTVGLRKLRPPIPQDLDSAGVRVTRTRTAPDPRG